MIHADGSDCDHEGSPLAAVSDVGGPRCAGGEPVTHVRINGSVLTIEEAVKAFQNIADAFTAVLSPLIASLASWAGQFGAALQPAARILAAAGEAYGAEMELADDDDEWPDSFTVTYEEQR
jgi:hypothetical protein